MNTVIDWDGRLRHVVSQQLERVMNTMTAKVFAVDGTLVRTLTFDDRLPTLLVHWPATLDAGQQRSADLGIRPRFFVMSLRAGEAEYHETTNIKDIATCVEVE